MPRRDRPVAAACARRAVTVALALALAGCARAVGGAPPDALEADAGVIDPATFEARAARGGCERDVQCTGGYTFATVDVCLAALGTVRTAYTRAVVELARQGRVRFDPAAAQRCLDELATASCNADRYFLCSGVYRGGGRAGDACARDVECAADLYCDVGVPPALRCPGRCRARDVAPGAVPATSSACRAEPGELPFVFFDGRCVSLRAAAAVGRGERCGYVETSPGRVASVPCVDELRCLRVAGGPSRCLEPRPEGAACADGACGFGLTCDRDARCRAVPPVTRVEGGPCALDGSVRCDGLLQLECTAEGRCARVGDGRAGSRCVPMGGFAGLCDEGLYCDLGAELPTCLPRRDDGAACRTGVECGGMSICHAGVCAALYCPP